MERLNIKTIKDIWSSGADYWRQLDVVFTCLWGLPLWLCHLATNFIDMNRLKKSIHNSNIIAPNWRWIDLEQSTPTFSITNIRAYQLLTMHGKNCVTTNQLRNKIDNPLIWERIGIEFGPQIYNDSKVFLWQIMPNGLFTASRALYMDHGSSIRTHCHCHFETVPLLLLFCPKV